MPPSTPTEFWPAVAQILDRLLLKESGVGPVGVAGILILLLIIWIIYRGFKEVVLFYGGEISRIAAERDKWENRYFKEKLRSSNSKTYSALPEDLDRLAEPGEPVTDKSKTAEQERRD